jgi:hypothetical protein
MRAGESGRLPISAGVTPNRVSGHVVGRTSSLVGKRWQATGVVSVQNRGYSREQGIALMAAASRVERQTGAFRKTTGRLRRAKKANVDALLKGIA